MERTERFYKIHLLLKQNKYVPVQRFLKELEVSRATFKRDIEYLRDRHHAPIAWDRENNGYCFTSPARHAPRYELPGLWFTVVQRK
jgi:predicted DNA-binding transcriptional regulator YafY